MEKHSRLVWSDEFDYEGSPDPSRWTFEVGKARTNNEAQFYTDSLESCRVENGRLVITGRQLEDGHYESARINTGGKASWQYGSIEFSCRLPSGRGTWPAVWMLADGIREGVRWPLCGEIDILEHIGRHQDHIHFSLHSQEFNHTRRNNPTSVHHIPGVSEGFHLYRMDWTRDGFAFSVDNIPLAELPRDGKTGDEAWPFDQKFHLIVNLALGGNWGGDIDDDALPASLELEYIRVYQ